MQDDGHVMARQALEQALESIPSGQPELVQELVGSFRDGAYKAIEAGRQFEADKDSLVARRDLLPEAGARRLYGDAQAEAFQNASAGLTTARNAAEQIQRAGLLGAQPRIAADREALARHEWDTAVGSAGTPDQLALRVLEVASSGSRDVLGVLNSDYARTYLAAKGLGGKELDETIASARRVVIGSIEDNPSKFTDTERRYARLYRSAGNMNAAIGAIGFSLRSVGTV